MTKVFIDGSSGTTGLRIYERIEARTDIELIRLPEEKRKDEAARKEALHEADIAFLCLPDEAAREAVKLVEGSDTVIIDTSTAHRTDPGWAYGFPELKGLREKIASSKRIANPGCHASGFIALIEPLVAEGVISKDTALTCLSLTGYSGGGKKMIAEYEAPERDSLLTAPRVYGIGQSHKHLKEMTKITGVTYSPIFSPIVAPFYSGMEVTVPIFTRLLNGATASDLYEALKNHYEGCQMVKVMPYGYNADKMLSAGGMEKRDDLKLYVYGNEERIIVSAVYDNLGKGASGAAVQCMNIMAGLDETTGLVLGD